MRVVDTTGNPNELAPISDKALLLSHMDVLNRPMILPDKYTELRIGMFVSFADNATGKSAIFPQETVQNPTSVANSFFFGLKDNSNIIPTRDGSKYMGVASHIDGRAIYYPPTAGDSIWGADNVGYIDVGGSSSATPYIRTFNGTTAITNASATGYNRYAFQTIGDTTATKAGVSLWRIKFKVYNSTTAQIWFNQSSSPSSATSEYTKGYTNLSENELVRILSGTGGWSATYQVSITSTSSNRFWSADNLGVSNLYFRHPFQTFSIRIHSYAFVTMTY